MTPWKNHSWYIADLAEVAAVRHFSNVPDGDGIAVYWKQGGHVTLWNQDMYEFDAAYAAWLTDLPLPY